MSERLRKPDQMKVLHILREAIPFLYRIPDQIYFKLDYTEFLIPQDEVAKARVDLEDQIGHFVMTYRRDTFNLCVPPKSHLCANVKGAELTPKQLVLLQDMEIRFAEKAVSFVAYQNPLELVDPKQTPLFDLYRRKSQIRKREEE